MKARAILFDLDGVIADSTHAVEASWRAWASRHGIDPELAIRNGHGRTTLEAIRVTAPDLAADASFAEMEALEASHVDSVVGIRGVARFIAQLERVGLPWAVATSGTRRIAIPRLHAAGVPLPRVLITADDVARGKPDPEPYRKAAQGLGLEARDCIVFEDAPVGVASGRAAGASVIRVTGNDGSVECGDTMACIRTFDDVQIDVTDATGKPAVLKLNVDGH